MNLGRMWALALLTSWLLMGCGSTLCTSENLAAALAAAEPGSTVEVGACTVTGAFEVPPGVRLAGAGPGRTILESSAQVALRLRTSADVATPTAVEGVTVVGDGSLATVFASGDGDAEVRDVTVDARTGVGLGARDLRRLTVASVDVEGVIPDDPDLAADEALTDTAPVLPDPLPTADECADTPLDFCVPGTVSSVSCDGGACGPFPAFCSACGTQVSVVSTYGVFVLNVDEATLESVTVRGFAAVAALFDGSPDQSITWTDGAVEGNLRFGIVANRLDATFDRITVSRTYSGFDATAVALRAFGEPDSAFLGSGLSMMDNQGFGVLQDGGSLDLTAVEASGNTHPAIYSGGATTVRITDSMLTNNRLLGIGLIGVTDAEVVGTTVDGVRMGSTIVLEDDLGSGNISLGDALHSVASPQMFLSSAALLGAERIGMVVDIGAASFDDMLCGADDDGICFLDGTSVETPPGVPGAIAVRVSPEDLGGIVSTASQGAGTWSDGIQRGGGALDDDAFTREVNVLGVIAPINSEGAEGAEGVIAPIN